MGKKIIFFSFLMGVSHLTFSETPLIKTQEIKCNGYASLCNRKFNEVAYIVSHNANSNQFCPVQDQDKTIEEQFYMGVRGFKLPIHYDYKNPLGYYKPLFEICIKQLNAKINAIVQKVKSEHPAIFQGLQNAENGVKKIQNEIAALQRTIDYKKKQLANAPIFSFTDNSKTSLGIEIGGLETKKGALALMEKSALKILDNAQAAFSFIDPSKDQELMTYSLQSSILQNAYATFLKNIPPSASERQIFACHALPKNELYWDHTSDLIDKAPAFLQKIIAPIKEPLKNFIKNLATELFGQTGDAGGLIPYTPCLLDRGALSLIDIFRLFKKLLDNNRFEVIHIVLNDFAHNLDDVAKAAKESGLISYMHTQDKNKEWPTLNTMIQTNKRVVLFDDWKGGEPMYPWIHSIDTFVPWHTKYNQTKIEEITKNIGPNFNPSEVTTRSFGSTANNQLFGISHSVTPRLAGDKSIAEKINRRPYLSERIKNFSNTTNHMVNFISLDFIEPNSEEWDILDEVNGVGKYEGKPLWVPRSK